MNKFVYFFRRLDWASAEDMSITLNGYTKGSKVVGMSATRDEVLVLIEVEAPASDKRFD